MVIPRFKKDYENKTIEELVKEQQSIIKEIIDFENKFILKTKKKEKEDQTLRDPSPTVVWRVRCMDLIMITELIDEKTRDEHGFGIDFE